MKRKKFKNKNNHQNGQKKKKKEPGEGPSQPARMAASTQHGHGIRTGIDGTCATHLRWETFIDSQWGGGLKAGLQRHSGMDAFFFCLHFLVCLE